MNAIEHIRRTVFKVTQTAFAELAGTTQPTVSRWEAGELEPSREEMSRIRDKALTLGHWDDRWFFESPPVQPADHAGAGAA